MKMSPDATLVMRLEGIPARIDSAMERGIPQPEWLDAMLVSVQLLLALRPDLGRSTGEMVARLFDGGEPL